MSFVYSRAYKVPVWAVINADRSLSEKISDKLSEYEPMKVAWPSLTFSATIKSLALQGWAHEVDKTMPFAISRDFLMFAVSKHLGNIKHLCGNPIRPYHTLNRVIASESDYERLFNDILDLEPDVSLSNIFSIGENCHSDGKKFRVYLTIGNVPINILQRLADHVITIGGVGSDVIVDNRQLNEIIEEIICKVVNVIGIK